MELVVDNNERVFIPTEMKYRCVVAETEFYTRGMSYTIYHDRDDPDDKNRRRYVRGSDGIYDDVALTNSTFKEIKNNANQKG